MFLSLPEKTPKLVWLGQQIVRKSYLWHRCETQLLGAGKIDTLLIHEPTIAGKLLDNLLPEISRGISNLIYQPRWRDWNYFYAQSTTV